MNDLIVRPLIAGEEALFDSYTEPALVGSEVFGHRYRDRVASGEYRPPWTWVALRGDTVVARAAWWGGPDDDEPVVLDWLDFTDSAAAGQLLTAGPSHTGYCLRLPAGWRDTPAVERAAQARITAAEDAGLAMLVERNHYRWTPDCGLPARTGRLEYRPEPDDAVILDIFRRLQQGSLDAHGRHAVEVSGSEAAAQEDLDNLLWMPSPRDWWRLAWTPGGDLAGLAAPCRNYNSAVIGFIGVLPEQRGHGYSCDLLAEATHFLVAEGAEQIGADTDVTNTPMAATFAKAHYPITEQRIDFTG